MKKTITLSLILHMFFSCQSEKIITEANLENDRANFDEFVNPNITDPQIDIINQNFHYALFYKLEDEREELLVHLGGTFSKTSGTTIFSKFAAKKGFHVINLAYPNLNNVTQCNTETDINCALNFRNEVFLGINDSNLVNVNTSNAISNRLYKLIVYLTEVDPQGNWQQYINSSGINWSKIIISGHSQGAGHAAYIAKLKPIKRALLFAGPNDYSIRYNQPANWLSFTSLTPITKYYAFLHLSDEVVNFNIQEQCLNSLGFNTIFNTNQSIYPFEFNNALFTNKTPQQNNEIGAPYHGSLITDRFTPLNNGTPQHASIWDYMLGVN